MRDWRSKSMMLAIAAALSACSDPRDCTETPGSTCVWAGTGELGFNGDGKHRLETRMYWPIDVELAPDGTPWVLDWNNHMVRRVLADGTFDTVVGDFLGDGPPDQSDLSPPGAPGDTVRLNHPTDLQFLNDGNVLFAAWHNHKLRNVNVDTGMVVVASGRGPGFAGDGDVVSKALYNQPKAIVRAADDSIYILDQRNFRVRKIVGSGITTVVGTGIAGFAGDGGSPLAAQLKFEAGGNPEPSGALALDAVGNLYISDGLNHRIRKVDFAADLITTIAGTGDAGFSGDGGLATDAQIDNVRDLEIFGDKLYLADSENHRVRVIDLATGIISTVIGDGDVKTLNRPFGIGIDDKGTLYVSDTFNSRILKVTP